MKKVNFFSLFAAAALSIGFVACNNDGDSTAAADTTATDVNTTSTTVSTTNEYAAMADSARVNSEAGNYLDARTGKPIRINVDTQTGARTNAETGEPVWRYVDKRTWWVYGGTPDAPNWDKVGEARMEGSKIEFKDNDKWVDYDRLYKELDIKNDEDWKMKMGDTKIKVDKDGDMKVKTPDGKYKVDADGNTKEKTDDKKVKTDEDGTKVKEDNK